MRPHQTRGTVPNERPARITSDIGVFSRLRYVPAIFSTGTLCMKYRQRPHSLTGLPACLGLIGCILAAHPIRSDAIIFESTADAGYNTNAPTGDLADSGWQFQGRWGNYLGTPIAPNLFITAKHVGGGAGQLFDFRGRTYVTINSFVDPASDLRIWEVCGIFTEFAKLVANGGEIGKPLVVFGRGTQRGAEVLVDDGLGTSLKGWEWGPTDHVQRWGENIVSEIADGGGNIGELIAATFDSPGGANESHLSPGDSGGGVFIRENGIWKLAGINYSVDGPFNTSTNGNGFNAAIFDDGGLYTKPLGEQWVYSVDLPVDKPSSFYATRIFSNLTWINSIIAQHAVTSYPPILQSATSLDESFADDTDALVDELTGTIMIDAPTETTFLRLRGCDPWEMDSMEFLNGKWILHYRAP